MRHSWVSRDLVVPLEVKTLSYLSELNLDIVRVDLVFEKRTI